MRLVPPPLVSPQAGQAGRYLSMQERPDEYDDLTSYWGQFVDTRMGKVKHVI